MWTHLNHFEQSLFRLDRSDYTQINPNLHKNCASRGPTLRCTSSNQTPWKIQYIHSFVLDMTMTQVIFPSSISKGFTGEQNVTVQYLMIRYFKLIHCQIWSILIQICYLVRIMQTHHKNKQTKKKKMNAVGWIQDKNKVISPVNTLHASTTLN